MGIKSLFSTKGAIFSTVAAVVIVAFGWITIEWTVNRVYVPEGYSMRLRYKGPPLPFLPDYNLPESKMGFAKVDENGRLLERGMVREMLGPGRHFRSFLYWDWDIIPDIVIRPGEVGIATSKLGKDLPPGEYLVDGDLGTTEYKGILRKVFGPGRYRVNDYAYSFTIIKTQEIRDQNQTKYAGWVVIPTGYVGVVTNLDNNPITGKKIGIQNEVFPPGIYPTNPKEQQIDIVEIGFREKSIKANLLTKPDGSIMFDDAGEPLIAHDGSGISFPSKDAFPINMDFTAIWGITPEQAPNVIKKFGNIDAIETKVVMPQIESICRNTGSQYNAVDLLVGDTRQEFQTATTEKFQKALIEKDVTLLYGLVRHIFIPQQIRKYKQEAFVSEELALTRMQETITAEMEANLREAEQKVELEAEKIRVETEKLVANTIAEGQKKAKETAAETQRIIAGIDKEIAVLEAQATVVLGQAKADATRMQEEAKANKFKLAVEAFGTSDAYNKWVFADGLPEDIELNLIFAGEGTFWTDLKSFSETMLGKQSTERRRNKMKKTGIGKQIRK